MNIEITVANRIAAVVGSPVIVCGNKGYTVTFTFDREWDGYDEKTARFVFFVDGKAKFIDVLFSGNTCDAPMLSNISQVTVGVYAGDLRTTTGATIKCLKSILCGGGGTHEEPPEDVYNQILEEVSTKLSSSGGTLTGNFFLDGNEFIHEGNTYLLEPYLDNVLNGRNITETASGNAITIDSASAPLQNLKLFGKTTQDGTPTPDAPIDLLSVGDSGSFEVGVYGGKNFVEITKDTSTSAGVTFTRNADNSFSLSGTGNANNVYHIGRAYLIQGTSYKITGCPNGGASNTYLIRVIYPDNSKNAEELGTGKTFTPTMTGFFTVGIRVQQGTVTDGLKFYPMIRYSSETDETYEPCNKQSLTMPYELRSVGNIKDVVDFNRGVLIQRSIKFTNFVFAKYNENNTFRAYNSNLTVGDTGVCNLYSICNTTVAGMPDKSFRNTGDGNFYVRDTNFSTADEINNAYANGELEIIGVLQTPNETPLTETEINAYRHLMTNKGNTTILSEATASVTYYPNNECAQAVGNVHSEMRSMMNELTQAIISIGGAE